MKGQILEVKLTSFYIDIHVDISGIDLYLFIIVIFTIIIHWSDTGQLKLDFTFNVWRHTTFVFWYILWL